ncbi:MAG: sugar ABC transporter ATP-binding protein [Spirochaetota bacterium]
METDGVLSIRNVSKRFGGTQALDGVSFDVQKGEIHALLGENGAGKSTLIKIISGVVQKDRGSVFLDGRELRVRNAQQSRELGINVVYQELALIPDLSVAENIFASSVNMNSMKLMKVGNLGSDVMSIVEMLDIDLRTPVRNLGIGAQQMVEIAGAISRKCRILILDEPTASLTNEEVKILYRIIRMLKGLGVIIIFISHKLSEVFDIADRATVMKDGRYVATDEVGNLDENSLIKLMTGRDLHDMYPPKGDNPGSLALEVGDYSGPGFQSVNFSLREGEILGMAGLTGAGRTELCTTLFGVQPSTGGSLRLFGKDFAPRDVLAAMRAGIGYLPEDRKQTGVFMQMDIRENTVAATIDGIARHGILSSARINECAREMIGKLSAKTGLLRDRILSLSGGNQQKIVLGRWLLANPRILIVDEPTRGIDVGAKFEIYQILRTLARSGMAIILISSELPEIIGMSDRILTLYKGKVSMEIDCHDPHLEEKIGCGIMGSPFRNPAEARA